MKQYLKADINDAFPLCSMLDIGDSFKALNK